MSLRNKRKASPLFHTQTKLAPTKLKRKKNKERAKRVKSVPLKKKKKQKEFHPYFGWNSKKKR